MKIVKLACKPGARFHFGKVALDVNMGLDDTSEWIHSDTLFSALVNTINRIDRGKTKGFIDCFNVGKIKISSAFYYISPQNGGAPIYFLPAPVTVPNLAGEDYKQIKKVKFVSKGIWEEGIPASEWTDEEKCLIINKRFVCKKGELSFLRNRIKQLKIYDVVSAPKVKVHTASKEDKLYNQTDVHLENDPTFDKDLNVGFYFLADIRDKDCESLFSLAMEMLVDSGIGGERSSGCGLFECVEYEPISNGFVSLMGTGYYSNLSLVYPKSSDEFKKLEHYHFITRGGRHLGNGGDNNFLKRVKMISEGAVCLSDEMECDNVDVSPKGDMSSLRYGKGLYVPLHENYGLKTKAL